MKTTWKDIQPVPTSQEFLDIVLSRTQRRLPTQIRSGFKISRIRAFYTRKVKCEKPSFPIWARLRMPATTTACEFAVLTPFYRQLPKRHAQRSSAPFSMAFRACRISTRSTPICTTLKPVLLATSCWSR